MTDLLPRNTTNFSRNRSRVGKIVDFRHLSRRISETVQDRAEKCRLIWHFRGQALLLRVLHVVACDNVRDCVLLKDDLNRVKKGLNSYELNFSLPTNSQNKLTELN